MSLKSLSAVKKAIGGERFHGIKDVSVHNYSTNEDYYYDDVLVTICYNVQYKQMDVSIIWEDDITQKNYKAINLHGKYNTNFQDFECIDNILHWKDGENQICISFS